VSHSVGSRTEYNLPGLTQIAAPAVDSDPIYERTPGYMTSTFPTLFPDGLGNFYANRLRKVDLGNYFAHLMKFESGLFARHRRFPWFVFNTLQRQRTHTQAKIFVKQNHEAGRMTAEELKGVVGRG
jgi:hypothetical protein